MDELAAPFQSVDDIITSLSLLESRFLARKDRRGIFTSAYLTMTRGISAGVTADTFNDGAWVTRYAVCFGNLYRTAILNFESGAFEEVPKAWRSSFETSQAGKNLLLQDLLLGVNAHINNDLALALVEASIDPDRESRRQDHFKVNELIRTATDEVQDQIGSIYAPVLRLLDLVFHRLDEDVANFSIDKARQSAWISAVSLANARDDAERLQVRESISDRASLLARLVLKPSARGRLLQLLQRIERMAPWWESLRPG